MTLVGIVANPASGRDIRRLVAGASVFGNAEKAAMVYRLLTGLGAAGVERALMMPAADGVSVTLRRMLRSPHRSVAMPHVDEIDMTLTSTAADSVHAVERMSEAGVAAIAVLGGDGTHRVVAKACGGEVPLCALSTGTNNVFPEMRETTVAGLAMGLVATGRATGATCRREAALTVEVPGTPPDVALVDVAVAREHFVGARALWRAADVRELFVTFADPGAVGLSAVAGMLRPLERGAGRGLHVRLAAPGEAVLTLEIPLAPGLVAPVGVASHRPIEMGETLALAPAPGVLALDGEREIERRRAEPATVRLSPGPLTIDVDAVMREAAASGLLRRSGEE